MTKRDIAKLKPGDKLRIKRGYVNSGMHAEFVEVYDGPSYSFAPGTNHLVVRMPGRSDTVVRRHEMFVAREATNDRP